MYFYLLACTVTLYMLTRHHRRKNSSTQTEESIVKDNFTQTDFMDIFTPPPSDFSDPFDIDYNFFKSKSEY